MDASDSIPLERPAALRGTVFIALFAALMAVGAYISIPIGPVPVVLQNMFVFLAALLLGSRRGLAAVALYLLAGACGLPVFAGATGGIGRFLGPTGGFLLGYLPAVALIGWVSARLGRRVAGDLLAMVLGSLLLYGCGVPWLKLVTGMPYGKALAVGFFPFLAGDAAKIVAAALIARAVRPILATGR